MSINIELQKIHRLYKEVTGEKEVNPHKVAEFAIKRGMEAPKPQTAVDLLAKKISKALRQEMRVDKVTGSPYRANHAFQANGQMTLWIDIDEAPRKHMMKSVRMRREQMVGDALQLTFDTEHWSRVNPEETPIDVDLDLTLDVELRKASEDIDKAA